MPAGYVIFPDDLNCYPKFVASTLLPNLTTITYQETGGHFAAMEDPEALGNDIRKFVKKVIELYPE